MGDIYRHTSQRVHYGFNQKENKRNQKRRNKIEIAKKFPSK